MYSATTYLYFFILILTPAVFYLADPSCPLEGRGLYVSICLLLLSLVPLRTAIARMKTIRENSPLAFRIYKYLLIAVAVLSVITIAAGRLTEPIADLCEWFYF